MISKALSFRASTSVVRSEHNLDCVVNTPIQSDVFIYMMSFFIVFVDFSDFFPAYSFVRYFFLLCAGIFLCMKFFAAKMARYNLFSLIFISFCGIIILSSYFARYDYESRNPLSASIVFLGGLVEFLFIAKYAKNRGRINVLLSVVFWLAVSTLFINDIFLLSVGGNHSLVGDKFHVAYFHIFVIALTLLRVMRRQKMKSVGFQVLLFCLVVLSIVIGIKVNCMTGLVGVCLMLVWLVICRISSSFARSPLTVVTAVFLSFLFMYVAVPIMNNTVVKHVIEGSLSHDTTLTGRTFIFKVTSRMLAKRPFLGYGYGVSYEVLSKSMFIPDAQNGLAEWLIAGGWCAGVLIIVAIGLAFKNSLRETVSIKYLDAIRVFIYAYICMGTVEITYNADFFAMLILLNTLSGTMYRDSLRSV